MMYNVFQLLKENSEVFTIQTTDKELNYNSRANFVTRPNVVLNISIVRIMTPLYLMV